MAKLLEQVRQQTEETQELLRAAICHEDSSYLSCMAYEILPDPRA